MKNAATNQRNRPGNDVNDAALAVAHADTTVDAHAAALFDARYAYVALLADLNADSSAIEIARKAHNAARNAYDAAYLAAYEAARSCARQRNLSVGARSQAAGDSADQTGVFG